MADQTLWGTYKLNDPIIKGRENLSPSDYEEVRLSVGGNTAVVGDFVTYRGEITAATPATHRDVITAVFVDADTQAANVPQYWCGQIIRPSTLPAPVSGEDWNPDTALIDGTMVVILKRGTKNVVTRAILTDVSLDVLTGYLMMIGSVAGEVKIFTNTWTDTTPTAVQNTLAIVEMLYLIGYADSVAEDIATSDIAVDISWAF